MRRSMSDPYLSPGVVAVLGLEGADPAGAAAIVLGPGAGLTVLPGEPLFEPALTLGQNYRLLRRYALPEKGETLDRLLALSGLKNRGWDKPFRKDMDGEKQLWKLMLTLAMSSGRVLLPRALEGLNSGRRAALDAMLAAWTGEGNSAILTVSSPREALELPSVRLLWLMKGERVLPLGREALEVRRDRERDGALLEELWKEAEG